jgi:LPXTG-site transpeptidase (sortase) family protein
VPDMPGSGDERDAGASPTAVAGRHGSLRWLLTVRVPRGVVLPVGPLFRRKPSARIHDHPTPVSMPAGATRAPVPATRTSAFGHSPGRPSLHAVANVCLGVSVGLLAYYGVTNAVMASDQAVLVEQIGGSVVAYKVPPLREALAATRSFDLEGWEAQDAAHWTSVAAGAAFGRLVIPRMELDVIVVKGVRTADLKKGPGWIEKTDMPGASGNVGISGHRTTYGHPFGRIDQLKPGDPIELYSPYRRYLYEVTRVFVVTPDRVEVIAHTEEPLLTLTACHPPYSAKYRIIAQAKLVDVRRLAAPPGP